MGRRCSEGAPPDIPEDQRQDYRRYSERLRRANWETADLLIALFHVCANAQQSLWCCRQVRMQMEQMKIWLNACEDIVAASSQLRPRGLEFVVLPPSPCKACVKKAQEAEGSAQSAKPPGREPEQGEEAGPEAVIDPSWSKEVDLLLWLARTATEEASESAAIATPVSAREVLKCLNDLMKLLSRQQRHVRFMGFISPDISFRVEQNCQECGEKWIDPHEPDPNSTVTGVDKPNIE